jgi:hypothetical protein
MKRLAALFYVAWTLVVLALRVSSSPLAPRLVLGPIEQDDSAQMKRATYSCFPALNFQMPDPKELPDDPAWWWCDPSTEYAFMGSYR